MALNSWQGLGVQALINMCSTPELFGTSLRTAINTCEQWNVYSWTFSARSEVLEDRMQVADPVDFANSICVVLVLSTLCHSWYRTLLPTCSSFLHIRYWWMWMDIYYVAHGAGYWLLFRIEQSLNSCMNNPFMKIGICGGVFQYSTWRTHWRNFLQSAWLFSPITYCQTLTAEHYPATFGSKDDHCSVTTRLAAVRTPSDVNA